jgi:hypothetical protein
MKRRKPLPRWQPKPGHMLFYRREMSISAVGTPRPPWPASISCRAGSATSSTSIYPRTAHQEGNSHEGPVVKNRRPEQAVEAAVFEHLRLRAMPGVFAFHCPNGGARSPIEAKILKAQGVTAGVSDVIAIKGGQVFGLELKAPGGRLSPRRP